MTNALTAAPWAWLATGLACAVAAVAIAAFRRSRGSTLAAPAAWTVASALAVAAVELLLARRPELAGSLAASLWRYAAAVGTCCPIMAVLGAKRPQDRGWQWVVLALWITLLVPAGQALAAPTGNRLELFPAWQLMIAALISLELLNYLPTRNALPAALVAAGQTCLFAGYVFNLRPGVEPMRVTLGLAAMLIAAALAHARPRTLSPRRSASPLSRRGLPRGPRELSAGLPNEATTPLDEFTRRWVAFRNAWGAFWALRIMARVNQTAELAHWPMRLEWGGFTSIAGATESPIDDGAAPQIQQTLDSLLWRFERVAGYPGGMRACSRGLSEAAPPE